MILMKWEVRSNVLDTRRRHIQQWAKFSEPKVNLIGNLIKRGRVQWAKQILGSVAVCFFQIYGRTVDNPTKWTVQSDVRCGHNPEEADWRESQTADGIWSDEFINRKWGTISDWAMWLQTAGCVIRPRKNVWYWENGSCTGVIQTIAPTNWILEGVR